jgi:ribosome-associated protein
VVCSSRSIVGVKAIAEEILFRLKEQKVVAHHVEGMIEGTWVPVDYGDVVVHIFLDKIRKYYDLESLWGDAPRKDFMLKPRKTAAKRRGKE